MQMQSMTLNNNIFNTFSEYFHREQRDLWKEHVDINFLFFCFVLQELHYI